MSGYYYRVVHVKDKWAEDFTEEKPVSSLEKAEARYNELVATGEYRAVWITRAAWNMVRDFVYQNPDKEPLL